MWSKRMLWTPPYNGDGHSHFPARWRSSGAEAAPSRTRRTGLARSYLPLMTALLLGLAGCGTSYPGERSSWALAATPNAVAGVTLDGRIDFLEHTDDLPSARMLESFKNSATDQELFIWWEGEWSGGEDGVEVELACSDARTKNVAAIDCAAATLTLSCEVVGSKLDCGDYVFQ